MTLITSVCNDRYVPGMLVFLYSFRTYHRDWSYPFKIYHRDDLSDASKKALLQVYPELQFEEVKDPLFIGKDAHYMCLLPFKEIQQDRVLFLDCDTLCLGRLDGLLSTKKDFAAVLDYEIKFPKRRHWEYVPWALRPFMYFNTGVFVVKGRYLQQDFYNRLLQQVEYNYTNRSKGKKTLWDQDIINGALRFKDAEVLPYTYNARKNLFKKGGKLETKELKLIHYTGGAKPWYVKGSGFLPLEGKYARYRHVHRLWHEQKRMFVQHHQFDPMDFAQVDS